MTACVGRTRRRSGASAEEGLAVAVAVVAATGPSSFRPLSACVYRPTMRSARDEQNDLLPAAALRAAPRLGRVPSLLDADELNAPYRAARRDRQRMRAPNRCDRYVEPDLPLLRARDARKVVPGIRSSGIVGAGIATADKGPLRRHPVFRSHVRGARTGDGSNVRGNVSPPRCLASVASRGVRPSSSRNPAKSGAEEYGSIEARVLGECLRKLPST